MADENIVLPQLPNEKVSMYFFDPKNPLQLQQQPMMVFLAEGRLEAAKFLARQLDIEQLRLLHKYVLQLGMCKVAPKN